MARPIDPVEQVGHYLFRLLRLSSVPAEVAFRRAVLRPVLEPDTELAAAGDPATVLSSRRSSSTSTSVPGGSPGWTSSARVLATFRFEPVDRRVSTPTFVWGVTSELRVERVLGLPCIQQRGR